MPEPTYPVPIFAQADLFAPVSAGTPASAHPPNLLPCDGIAEYYGEVFSPEDAATWFARLLTAIAWENDVVRLGGKTLEMARQVAWFADEARSYRYSGSLKTAHPWPEDVLALKAVVERLTDHTYNACLANLYHHGGQGVGWHSDNEAELAPQGAIASLSFGAARRFVFKHKTRAHKVELALVSGSLLVMRGSCQTYWQHTVPKEAAVTQPRINLTFRQRRSDVAAV